MATDLILYSSKTKHSSLAPSPSSAADYVDNNNGPVTGLKLASEKAMPNVYKFMPLTWTCLMKDGKNGQLRI